jgi:hypothetical protein
MRLDEAEQDLQLALYALACRELPDLSELGQVEDLVYLYPRIVQAGGLARRAQQVTADLADRTQERIRTHIAAVVAERFDYSPEADCKWCEFKRICPRHHGEDVPL